MTRKARSRPLVGRSSVSVSGAGASDSVRRQGTAAPRVAVLCRNRVIAEPLGPALSRAGTEPLFFAAPADLPALLACAELAPDVLVIVEPDAEVVAATALAVRERWPRTKLIAAGLALATDLTPALTVAGIVDVVLAPEPLGALRTAIRALRGGNHRWRVRVRGAWRRWGLGKYNARPG